MPRPAALSSFALAALILLAAPCSAAVLYVDAALASGLNDGSSWEDAFQGVGGLAAAITASASGDQIWVRTGTYKPTTTTTRTISLNLKSGVSIFGGFAGGETLLEQRDPALNVTILSGDLQNNDPTITDNSHHIVRGNSANATASLDGFTITGGNANGPMASDHDRGGGALMLSASTGVFRNCIFTNNRCTFGGGAVYVRSSSPSFFDTTFEGNLGGSFGGAFDIFQNSNPIFERCIVRNNSAARAGGIEAFGNCAPQIRNTLVTNNTATGAGGGGAFFIASGSTATIRDCTIVANKANVLCGGILNNASTASLSNCILWGNSGPGGAITAAQQITNQAGGSTTASYSTIQFGLTGAGNNGLDPQFVDEAGADFHVGSSSPCIDSGNNALVAAVSTTDLDGNTRFVDDPAIVDSGLGTPPIVDRGAYERQLPPPPTCVADLDGNGLVDGADFGALLAEWDNRGGSADLNEDGIVDGADSGLMLAAWGDCPR